MPINLEVEQARREQIDAFARYLRTGDEQALYCLEDWFVEELILEGLF